jgi:hypothetical protein
MLKPSDAHLWVRCPLAGSIMTTGEYYGTPPLEPEFTSDDSRREGTCAHWVAENVFTGRVETTREMIGHTHNNGWVVDEDMAWRVAGYIDYVRGFGTPVATEQQVGLYGLVRGRLDTVTASSGAVVRVFDYKDGWRPVEATENYTMLCYGLAVVGEVAGEYGGTPDLELHVYQPRPTHPDGPARVWRIEHADLGRWNGWLYERATDCLPEYQPAGRPGHQCGDCPAAASCHALGASVAAQYETVSDRRMVNHSPEAMAAELDFLELAETLVSARRSALQSEAMARIDRGQFIPGGWGVTPKLGNRKFTVSPDIVERATGVRPEKIVPMTPAELERNGVAADIVNMLSTRPFIGRKLTKHMNAIGKRMFKTT